MPSHPVLLSGREQQALEAILAHVTSRSGCDFTRYNRNSMARRVLRRMIDTQSRGMEEYLALLTARPGEVGALLDTLTIRVSEFFRDPEVFELVAAEVLPGIVRGKRAAGDRSLRIWSAACACGEELYSLAMLTLECLAALEGDSPWTLTFLGTDLDREALALARRGVFSERGLRTVPPAFRAKYFFPVPVGTESWRLVPALTELCAFQPFDLTSGKHLSPPGGVFAEYDCIACRNFFIYCQNALKDEVLYRMHRGLRPGGCLILGKAENLPSSLEQWYIPLDRRLHVYRRKGGSSGE